MTHSYNFGFDRLASYVLITLMNFVKKWTNLRLINEPPHLLAMRYFARYPQETNFTYEVHVII